MIACLQCSTAFPEEMKDPSKIRRVCNNPDSQHYLCAECRLRATQCSIFGSSQQSCRLPDTFCSLSGSQEGCITAYEDACMVKHLKKNFYSVRPNGNYVDATYALAKCPCSECPYSFYPVRDGSTRLYQTDSSDARLYKFSSVHPRNVAYLSEKSLHNTKGECRSYEIANYKEGRLHGKYVVLQLMRDNDKHLIQDYSYYALTETITKPIVMLAIFEFQNGFLKRVDQYFSFQYRAIREMMDAIQSPITPENLYEILVGTPEITAKNGFIIMSHHRYGDYNNLVHMTHYIMSYNGLKIKEFPTNYDPILPVPYHSAKMHIADFKLYLSPKIQEKFPTAAFHDFPYDVTLIYDHVWKQTTYYGMCLKKFTGTSPKAVSIYYDNLKTSIQSTSEFSLIPTEDGSKTIYDICTYKRYYRETGQLHHIYQLKSSGNPGNSPKKWGNDISYHPNGQICRLVHYENGKPSGYVYYYSTNGTITSIAHYQDGIKSILYQKS